MQQFIGAVEYLHMCHVAHRDLKLDNIVLTDENRAGGAAALPFIKLCDFGFAKAWGSCSNAAMLTRIGVRGRRGGLRVAWCGVGGDGGCMPAGRCPCMAVLLPMRMWAFLCHIVGPYLGSPAPAAAARGPTVLPAYLSGWMDAELPNGGRRPLIVIAPCSVKWRQLLATSMSLALPLGGHACCVAPPLPQTPVYMSPQQTTQEKGEAYSATAADVWACGVLLFVCLLGGCRSTGRPVPVPLGGCTTNLGSRLGP